MKIGEYFILFWWLSLETFSQSERNTLALPQAALQSLYKYKLSLVLQLHQGPVLGHTTDRIEKRRKSPAPSCIRIQGFFSSIPAPCYSGWVVGCQGKPDLHLVLHSQTAASHCIDYSTVLPVIAVTTTLWADHVKINYYFRSNWERYRSSSCRIFGCGKLADII